jgi:hypothetical protein
MMGGWRAHFSPRARLFLGCLSLCYLYFFPYFPDINNPNENVRLYMTRAIVEEGTLAIGRREKDGAGFTDHGAAIDAWGWVNDKALVCDDAAGRAPRCAGELYAAKAPGTSLLGVPVYAALQAATEGPVDKTEAIFWLRLCCVLFPTIVFLWVLWPFLAPFAPSEAARGVAVLAYALGSMSFTYAHMFAGHQLAGIFLFAAFICLHRASQQQPSARARWFAGAGLFAPLAVAMEYPSAIAVLALVLWALWLRPGARSVFAALAGALAPAAAVGYFHAVAFGRPWTTPYGFLENPQFVEDIAPGFLGIRGPTLEAFAGSFFAPFNGLFFFSPWSVCAFIAAAWWLARGRKSAAPALSHNRAAIWAAVGVLLAFSLFISSHSLWRGGWTIGPRYITAITPFVALLGAVITEVHGGRLRGLGFVLSAGLALASVAVTVACSMVSQGFPFSFYNPFVEVALPLLREGWVAQNVGSSVLGLQGLSSAAPFAALVLIAAAVVFSWSPKSPSCRAGAVFVAVCVLVGLSLARQPWNKARAKDLVWLREQWRPAHSSPLAASKLVLEQTVQSGRATEAQRIELARVRSLLELQPNISRLLEPPSPPRVE